jgi:hypothetical protein
MSRPALVPTQPPTQRVPGTLVGDKAAVPKSRIHGAIPPVPQFVFILWVLVKHRDNFTFTFFLPFDSEITTIKEFDP